MLTQDEKQTRQIKKIPALLNPRLLFIGNFSRSVQSNFGPCKYFPKVIAGVKLEIAKGTTN